MKTIIFLLILLATSCSSNCGERPKTTKRKEGQIVYLKPDSTRVSILYVYRYHYAVQYFANEKQVKLIVEDSQIY